MKTHQVFALAGGALLLGSTLMPSQNTNMWRALDLIGTYFTVGILPVVMAVTGLAGALAGLLHRGTIALLCGLLAFTWLIVCTRLNMLAFALEPYFFLSLIGSVSLSVAGIVALTSGRTK